MTSLVSRNCTSSWSADQGRKWTRACRKTHVALSFTACAEKAASLWLSTKCTFSWLIKMFPATLCGTNVPLWTLPLCARRLSQHSVPHGTTMFLFLHTLVFISLQCVVCHDEYCNGHQVDLVDTPCHAMCYMCTLISGLLRASFTVRRVYIEDAMTVYVSSHSTAQGSIMLLMYIGNCKWAGHTMIRYQKVNHSTPENGNVEVQ